MGMHQVNLWSPTGPDRKLIRENKYEKAVLLAGGGCVELAQADGDAPGESVVPVGPERNINRENTSEKMVLLAGRTVWSWPRLMGMRQVHLWSRWGQAEKQMLK